MSHNDIRIGTLCGMSNAVKHLPQLLPHGFECFSLTFWQKIDVDLEAAADEILGDKAYISSIGFFGNPLMKPEHADGVAKCIEGGHVLTIEYDKLLEIYFQNPEFGHYFLILTSRRLLENNARLEETHRTEQIAPPIAVASGTVEL